MHGLQSPSVWLRCEALYRNRTAPHVHVIKYVCIVGGGRIYCNISVYSPAERSIISSPSCIFPLRFGWQAIHAPRLLLFWQLRQSLTKHNCILEGNLFDRMLRCIDDPTSPCSLNVRRRLKVTRIGSHHFLVLGLSYLILSKIEIFGDRHLMLCLVLSSSLFAFGRAHHEGPFRHPH
ncbi:MAG: hypothetical protein RL240_4405 [Planctomycetota bacterium]